MSAQRGPAQAMGGPPPKSKKLRAVMARLMPILALLAFFYFFINLLRLTMPLYLMQVIDRVVSSESVETLIFITLIAGIALIVSALLTTLTKVMQSRSALWMESSLFAPLTKAAINGKLTGQSTGAGAVRDLYQLRQVASGPILGTLFEVPWTPVFLGIIWYMHPWFGIFSVTVGVVIFGLALINDAVSKSAQNEAQKEQQTVVKNVEQGLESFDSMRAMGIVPKFVARLSDAIGRGQGAQSTIDERQAVWTSMIRFVRSFAQVGILGLGAYLVLQAEATTGSMIAASILQSLALSPIDQSVNAVRAIKGTRMAYQRVNRQLAAISENTDRLPMDGVPALNVDLKQAMFMPQGLGRPVLRPMNWNVEAGTMTGILGSSASGKTTLARLVAGIVAPTSGSLAINDLEVHRLAGDDLGRLIGYMPQTVVPMPGTVADNIARFGDADDPDRMAKIVEAAQMAGIHETIVSLPNRYDTPLEEQALARLSRSQLQKLFLARAFYGKPRLLVLDEPMAYLDKAGETAVVEALETFRESGATIFVVAQRPPFLKTCDKVIFLRDGGVADFAEPEKVLANISRNPAGNPRLVDGGGQQRRAG
ncbi:MAG: ATP-binding cassette domain-containing protein [Pseudomonadota bacterium]